MRVASFAWQACLWLALALSACALPAGGDDSEGEVDGTGAGETEGPEPIPEACLIGGEAPRSVVELVERVEALPHPVTIPCVLASLPRPLSLVATSSDFSVQPAKGDDNPRIFVLGEGLVLSVVPLGEGRELLEMSEWVEATKTIKAELEFPIDGALSVEEAYDLDFANGLTRCGLCHRNEYESPTRPGAYVSDAMRPTPDSLVPIDTLGPALDACDWAGEPERCALLSALLDHGEVQQGAFDDALPTFFD